jgi:hypothetical protein
MPRSWVMERSIGFDGAGKVSAPETVLRAFRGNEREEDDDEEEEVAEAPPAPPRRRSTGVTEVAF